MMQNYLYNNFSQTGNEELFKKRRKRKINSLQCDSKISSQNFKKKKKLLKNENNCSEAQIVKKSYNFNETVNYLEVMAEPELLPSIPNTFKLHLSENKNYKKVNSFFNNILFNTSVNSNTKDRFNNILDLEKSVPIKVKKTFNEMDMPSKNKSIFTDIYKKIKKKKTENNILEMKNILKAKKQKSKITSSSKSDLLPQSTAFNSALNVLSYADFYEISERNAFIFHLHHPCKFSFFGELKITLIAGEIEIMGFKLNKFSRSKTIKVYSPKCYTPVVIESKAFETQDFEEKDVLKQNLKTFLSENKIQQLFEYLRVNDTILLMEKEISKFGMAIKKYLDFPIFPQHLENLSSISESLKKLQSLFNFDLSLTDNQFEKSSEWENIKLSKCSIIYGGKGVGKSTLLKYLINQLISKNERILVLDLDPGQPEFTPPGYVSAVIIEEPLLGPNFSHLTKSQVMLYFGNVNTAQSPSKYLDCVKYIIDWCKTNKELGALKWLVNTMGFCKGLGVELMISILKLLEPDTVIQIRSSSSQNNYPYNLTPIVINSKKGFKIMAPENNISFEHFIINSVAQSKTKYIQNELVPAELRNVMMVSYFSEILNSPYDNFNSVQPYVVPFINIYLGVDSFLRPYEILKSFNGSVVSLSHFEHTHEIIFSTGSEYNINFKIVLQPSPSPSFGLGLIRGIDCDQKNFYIISPLPLEELKKVNCFTLGKINPPDFIYLNQETVKGPTLYTSLYKGHVTKKVKRMFRPLVYPNQ